MGVIMAEITKSMEYELWKKINKPSTSPQPPTEACELIYTPYRRIWLPQPRIHQFTRVQAEKSSLSQNS